MTKSTAYALELSREKKSPVVIFDEAEVALYALQPELLPVVTQDQKKWTLVKIIGCSRFTPDITMQSLDAVLNDQKTYGVGVIDAWDTGYEVGVFQKVGCR